MNMHDWARIRQLTVNIASTLKRYGPPIVAVLTVLTGLITFYDAITDVLRLLPRYVNGALFIGPCIAGIAISRYRYAVRLVALKRDFSQRSSADYRTLSWVINAENGNFSESEKSVKARA